MDGGQRTAPDGFRDVRRASPGRGPLCPPKLQVAIIFAQGHGDTARFHAAKECAALRLLTSGCDAGIAGNIQITPKLTRLRLVMPLRA